MKLNNALESRALLLLCGGENMKKQIPSKYLYIFFILLWIAGIVTKQYDNYLLLCIISVLMCVCLIVDAKNDPDGKIIYLDMIGFWRGLRKKTLAIIVSVITFLAWLIIGISSLLRTIN